MRTGIVAIVAVAIVAILAVAIVPHLGFWAESKVDDADRWIRNDISDKAVLDAYGEELNAEEARLRDHYCEIFKLRSQIKDRESRRVAMQDSLEHEKKILGSARQKLLSSEPGDSVVVGGVRYTHAQLEADAIGRAKSCRVLTKKIAGETAALTELGNAYGQAEAGLRTAREGLENSKTDYEIEKAEFAALVALEEVRGFIGGLDLSRGSGESVSQARSLWKERLTKKRAGHEYDLLMASAFESGPITTWGLEFDPERNDALDAIDSVLGPAIGPFDPEEDN